MAIRTYSTSYPGVAASKVTKSHCEGAPKRIGKIDVSTPEVTNSVVGCLCKAHNRPPVGRRGEQHEGGQGGDQGAHLISLSTFCSFGAHRKVRIGSFYFRVVRNDHKFLKFNDYISLFKLPSANRGEFIPMKRKRVNLSITDGIAMVLLDRPEVLNALDQQMWEELVNVFRSVTNDPKVRVVIISGIGRGFCVGADLKEVAWRGESQIQSRRRIEANNQQLAREMIGAPMPIIAAINGYALGGGVEIALAADLRIASAEARLGFPETTIGRFISGGASLMLPRAVGIAWAKRLIYTGEHIDAAKALTIGLVEEVTAPETLTERAVELAKTIANNAPVSIALAKKVLNRVSVGDLETALAFETEALLATYSTDDNEQGVAAFARGEKPKFSGK